MNETNNLVASMMEKLPQASSLTLSSVCSRPLTQIRTTQLRMRSPEWATLTEEQREQETERYSEAERGVRDACLLGNETVHMLNYLTEVLPCIFLASARS
jgi:hypothetical protein